MWSTTRFDHVRADEVVAAEQEVAAFERTRESLKDKMPTCLRGSVRPPSEDQLRSSSGRTRSENDVVPMDVSVLKGEGGKGKDGKGKEGTGKEGKGKTKAKEDRDKFDPKSSSNKFKKCFYTDKVGHVRADCRKKKRDDEERRNMWAQNSLNSSTASMSPPGLTNITTNTSGASSSSLRFPPLSRMTNFTVRCVSLP